METPQSAQRRSVNPSTGTESDGISLKTIDRNPQDDPMAANKALLNENQETADEVVASTNSHKSQPPQASTIKGWAWELLAWTTSFASMVTIVGILLATQNKALPEWDHQINLSTLLSVFAQISSTALLVPASGCISQLKWLWFVGRSRTLSDFDTFDEASRGPLSSLWLIWKTRASHLVSLGALLTVINLAFQPFVQQTVSFPQRLVSNGTATTPVMHNLTTKILLNEEQTLSPAITAAIYAGLNIGAKLTDVVPNCASGNCTWDPYDSLALCANTVTNLTHLLTRTPAGTDPSDCSLPVPTYGHFCNYSLPNGAFLMAQNELVNITTGIGHTIAFPNSSVILDFFMIYYSPELRDFAAIEASVGFCGQTFDSSVKNGQINTTEVGRWGKLNTSVDPSEFLGMLPVVGNGITLYVEVAYENALLDTLKDIFSGDYFVNESGNKHFSTVAVEALYNSITGSQSQDDLASLQAFTDNFALSVSNSFRTGVGNEDVAGIMYSVETYVSVTWLWLIFPGLVVLISLVFLLATMVKNSGRRAKVWKSSSLAALSGLSIETRAHLGDLTSTATVEERAQGIKVRLIEDEGRWKLDIE